MYEKPSRLEIAMPPVIFDCGTCKRSLSFLVFLMGIDDSHSSEFVASNVAAKVFLAAAWCFFGGHKYPSSVLLWIGVMLFTVLFSAILHGAILLQPCGSSFLSLFVVLHYNVAMIGQKKSSRSNVVV